MGLTVSCTRKTNERACWRLLLKHVSNRFDTISRARRFFVVQQSSSGWFSFIRSHGPYILPGDKKLARVKK